MERVNFVKWISALQLDYMDRPRHRGNATVRITDIREGGRTLGRELIRPGKRGRKEQQGSKQAAGAEETFQVSGIIDTRHRRGAARLSRRGMLPKRAICGNLGKAGGRSAGRLGPQHDRPRRHVRMLVHPGSTAATAVRDVPRSAPRLAGSASGSPFGRVVFWRRLRKKEGNIARGLGFDSRLL